MTKCEHCAELEKANEELRRQVGQFRAWAVSFQKAREAADRYAQTLQARIAIMRTKGQ